MSEQREERHDPDDETPADRRNANIVMVVGFIILVGAGIWLANAMVNARKADECIASGRRNCTPIDAPSRFDPPAR